MKNKKIVVYPNKILREQAVEVEKIDQKIKDLVKEMKKIMIQNQGVGLAANQIGKNLAIFTAFCNNRFYTFINPKIIKLSKKEEVLEEGCLSLPNIWGQIKRSSMVVVSYKDLWGKDRKIRASGLLAQIIQHEVDHLNGKLFIDKALEIYKIQPPNE
jgi:peptide deformylase